MNIAGLKFEKLVPNEYIFNQFIVDDIKDFTMDYDDTQCTILMPKHNPKVEQYLDVLSRNPYLNILSCELEDFYNVYGLLIKDSDVNISTKNQFVFSSKSSYTRYLLSQVDTLESFLSQIKSILNSYGMQLVKYPLSEDAETANRAIYRITELGKQVSHKTGSDVLKDEVQAQSTIEFEFTFLDMIMYEDFRTRYQNVDLLSNFTEFYTVDKNNDSWIANVKWSELPTDFTQDFSQDNQGNNAYSFTITAEVHHYIVYDKLYKSIQTIITKICSTNSGNESLVEVSEDSDAINSSYEDLRKL